MPPIFASPLGLVLLLLVAIDGQVNCQAKGNLSLDEQIDAIFAATLQTVDYQVHDTSSHPWTHLLALQNEKTLAVIEFNQVASSSSSSPTYRHYGPHESLQMHDCVMFDMIKRQKDGNAFLEQLTKSKNNTSLLQLRASSKTLLEVARLCQLLWKRTAGQQQSSEPFSLLDILFNIGRFVPGTLWCGPGDRAGSYWNLGSKAELDSCCREHDHCPVRLAGQEQAYGEVNSRDYTVSWCQCDQRFKQCLIETQSDIGGKVWSVFEFFQAGCLEAVSSDCRRKRDNGTRQACEEQFRIRRLPDNRKR